MIGVRGSARLLPEPNAPPDVPHVNYGVRTSIAVNGGGSVYESSGDRRKILTSFLVILNKPDIKYCDSVVGIPSETYSMLASKRTCARSNRPTSRTKDMAAFSPETTRVLRIYGRRRRQAETLVRYRRLRPRKCLV